MIKYISLLIITIMTALPLGGQTPPQPWENYNALLNVDLFIKGQIIDTTIVPIQSPYFRWPEKRVLARIKIDSVLYDDLNHSFHLETITVLLPSLVDFNEASPDYNSNTISYPLFFKKNKIFYMGLIQSKEEDWYLSSSRYPYFSFLPLTSELIEQAYLWRKEINLSRHQALTIGLRYFEMEKQFLSLNLVGGDFYQGSPRQLKSKPRTSALQLFWKIQDKRRTRNPIFIDTKTGKVYE